MKKLFFLSFAIIMFSCGSESNEKVNDKPDSLLTQEQMVDFLIDVQLLEARIKELRVAHDSSKVLFEYYETKLYKAHNFSDSVYLNSYNYYIEHPIELKEIYETVSDSLNARNEAFKEMEEK